jgi:hypothetical protein
MESSLLQQTLFSSKALVSVDNELPSLSAIELEVIPVKQNLDYFFSDSVHRISVTKGKLPANVTNIAGLRAETHFSSKISFENVKDIHRWLNNMNVNEPLTEFQGANI